MSRRAFNLPNILTYARIIAVPVVVACLFWPKDDWVRWTALGIYAVAGITDFLDGYLARAWAQQSSMGRMLDPIADKLLIGAVLIMLVYTGDIRGFAVWAAIVILCREMLVSGLREFLAEVRVSVPVSQLAKWKTAVQIVALGFLIAGTAGDDVLPKGWTAMIGVALLWFAAILTLYTGYDYFKAGIRHILAEDEKQP